MTARFATPEEINAWNDYILANPDKGNVFQSAEFAAQKKAAGWTPRYLRIGDITLTILEKRIFSLGKVWYAPKGPGVSSVDELDALLPELQSFAAKHGVFMIKIEPELLDQPDIQAALTQHGLRRTDAIQPNAHTVTVDIGADLDTVLSQLHQKGRHAIRRATRDGVSVTRVASNDENCQLMYKLLADTAAGSFRIRSYAYYKSFWQRYAAAGMGQLFFAVVDGTVAAGAYALSYGSKSTYKDGASSKQRTTYGASHLLQWEVIAWAKEQGATIHDLCGTPPASAITDEQHAYYGLGRFKTSFNKQVTDYVGAWDVVVHPLVYRLWVTIGQRIVFKLHNLRHHENWW